MKKIYISILLSLFMVNAGEVKVAVAANVSYAIVDLVKLFNVTHPDTKIQVILGSSGKLTAQIQYGAPFDIFMSANMMYPNKLFKENLSAIVPVVYAQGALVLLSVHQRDFTEGLSILTKPYINKIAIANPKSAPYGKAAKEALVDAHLYDMVKNKLIYGESISHTLSFSTTAADIGIVAKSSLMSPKMSQYKEHIHWTEVDEVLYTPIDQGIVILKKAQENIEAKAFYDFILSPVAKSILTQYGYKVK